MAILFVTVAILCITVARLFVTVAILCITVDRLCVTVAILYVTVAILCVTVAILYVTVAILCVTVAILCEINNKYNSVQFQLKLPVGTELGKRFNKTTLLVFIFLQAEPVII